MRIIVNHLTRMRQGFICVAGIDADRGAHVRPETDDRLSVRRLTTFGGIFDIGRLVDLGRTSYVGHPPEVEDYRFDPRRAAYRRTLTPDEFWSQLRQVAHPRLSDIFGPELTLTGQHAYTVAAGHGLASLGCLALTGTPELYLRPRPGRTDQVRLRFSDGERDVDASVTDIRLYDLAEFSPKHDLIARIASRLPRGGSIILSIGLTRAYAQDSDHLPVHWLQVNNIHVEAGPLWQLKGG